MERKPVYTTGKLIGFFGGLLAFILIATLLNINPGHRETTYMLAIATLMAIWWMTEAVPVAITALLPVVLYPLFGIMNGKDVSATYFNHLIFLFIGGFIVALAMEKWNLHRRIALKILLWIGVSPLKILIGFMVATAFLSMWISNTATAMMMVPIALSVISQLEQDLGKEKMQNYSVALLLGIAFSASIGGIATLIGTPPNIAFTMIFSQSFPGAPEITFANWMLFGVPISLIMLVVAILVLYLIYVPKIKWQQNIREHLREQYQQLGKMSFEEWTVLIAFIILALLWLFRSGFDINLGHVRLKLAGWSKLFAHPEYFNDGTAAILVAIILFMIPSKRDKTDRIMDCQTIKRLPWNIVLLFGGGFALAAGFGASGLSKWIAQQFENLSHLNIVLFIGIIALTVAILTEFTSNTATTQMVLPILAAVAVGINVNPLLLMVPATIAASLAFMLPVATPPNIIIFGTNRVTIPQMLKAGILLDLIGVLVVTALMLTLGVHVFHINLHSVPQWIHSFNVK